MFWGSRVVSGSSLGGPCWSRKLFSVRGAGSGSPSWAGGFPELWGLFGEPFKAWGHLQPEEQAWG